MLLLSLSSFRIPDHPATPRHSLLLRERRLSRDEAGFDSNRNITNAIRMEGALLVSALLHTAHATSTSSLLLSSPA
jgi:hypothetical protein